MDVVNVKYSLSLTFKDNETGMDCTVNVSIGDDGNTLVYKDKEFRLKQFQRNVLDYMEDIALDEFKVF